MMTIWELKREVNNRSRELISLALLAKIEDKCREMYRHMWYSKSRREFKPDSLEQTCNKILKFLKVKGIFYVFEESNFLVREKDVVKYYLSETEYIYHSRNWFDERDIGQINGKYYAPSCIITYQTYNSASGRMQTRSDLTWNVGPVSCCTRCRMITPDAEMVYSEIANGTVDRVCFNSLVNWVNPQTNIARPIGSYHSHKNDWLFKNCRIKDEKSIPMGLEIEMHSIFGNNTESAMSSAAKILLAKDDEDNNFYFEYDGSLWEGGFEMITNPMTLEFHQAWWTKMLPAIRKNCVAYNVEKHYAMMNGIKNPEEPPVPADYGIHITIHRRNISDACLTKLVKFFDDINNQEFLWCIAQRSKMYGGYLLGSTDKPQAKTTLRIRDKKVIGGLDRRQPVNVKANSCVEFRLFRSTLNTVSFLKNLEFLDALISYINGCPGVKVNHKTFIVWLANRENIKRYPNLVQYLQHPLFFVKGVGKIKNAWAQWFSGSKLSIRDPLKEFGPVILHHDSHNEAERSMI